MHVLDRRKRKIELELMEEAGRSARAAFTPALEATPVVRASRAFFEMGVAPGAAAAAAPPPGPPPAVFRERDTGRVRTFYRELVVRFRPGVPDKRRRDALARWSLEVRATNRFVKDQVVVHDASRRRSGADLLDPVNELAEIDEVVFATPNFVSEYRRQAAVSVPAAQWHLRNLGKQAGQVKGEDVRALEAWKTSRGKRAVVVAILDDGVDVDHPNLRARVWKNPKKTDKDRLGRDFFLPDDHPDHFNPRPKKFRFPFDQLAGNDIHGTPCAGVVAAAGKGAWGIAPLCRVLAVKIFHADELARDDRVADAIRYGATRADILSCSWSGPSSPDIELALEDAGRLGRGGRGAAIFAATGNDFGRPVAFPAAHEETIAVGASTDGAQLASYSNVGDEVDVVAPSSGGVQGIFTTDVSLPGRGFNVGQAAQGGKDGLHTNAFGGTSSATPLAAGVGALVLSVQPTLDRQALRDILCATAAKIGGAGEYDANGHSRRFGFGRVDAAAAVAAAQDAS